MVPDRQYCKDTRNNTTQQTKTQQRKKVDYRYFEKGEYAGKPFPCYVELNSQSLWLSSPQIERLLDWQLDSSRKKLASKSFKTFSSLGSRLGKLVKVDDRNEKVRVYPLRPVVIQLIAWDAITHGNVNAVKYLMGGLSDSIESIVLGQYGIELDTSVRNERIKCYLKGYHPGIDTIYERAIDEYESQYGEEPSRHWLSEVMKFTNTEINRRVLGVSHFRGNRKKNASPEQLRQLEHYYGFLTKSGERHPEMSWKELLNNTLRRFTW